MSLFLFYLEFLQRCGRKGPGDEGLSRAPSLGKWELYVTTSSKGPTEQLSDSGLLQNSPHEMHLPSTPKDDILETK